MERERWIGAKLKRTMTNEFGTFLLPENKVLDEEDLDMLAKHNVVLTERDVYWEKEKKTERKVKSREQEKLNLKRLIEETTEQVREVFDHVRYQNKIPLQEVRSEVIPSIQQAAENRNLIQLFEELQAKDDYTYRHNIGVGVISTLLGNWLNLDESELSLLTIAATLHDVGKMKVPEEILNKPGKLTYEEFEEVKKHTVYGYEIIKSTYSLTHRCALVALQHHEREDGKGYPFGLKKDKIDYLSKIVAVADVFHAMTSQRVYQDAKPFYMVVEEMRQGTFGKFDPHIVNVFLQKIMDTLVGNTAVLTDGRVGTIVMIHYEDPFNPLIQSGDEFIDLRKEVDVHLDKVLDE